jgi:hypothetical protein
MPVLDWLRSAGDRLGLLRFVSTTNPAPPQKIPMRTVSLSELMIEVRKDEVETLAQQPAELSQPFEKVFDAAGIETPEHGWTIEKLKQHLADNDCKNKPREEIQKAILAALTADKAHVQDVVKDALARDRALDAFEESVHAKMHDRVTARQEKIISLEDEVKSLQREISQLKDEAKADEASWRAWHERKVAREKEMALALSYLLDQPVLDVDSKPPPDLNCPCKRPGAQL